MRRLLLLSLFAAAPCVYAARVHAADAPPAELPGAANPPAVANPPAADAKVGKLPFVEFDVSKKQVRVECEALAVDAPLEFFVCTAGTAEHEAVLRTRAKPSHINVGLLALGLKPGSPITFMESQRKWIPPQGPPLHLSVEFEKEGKTVSYPAYRWIRDIKTKREPKAFTWIFAGSRLSGEGKFGADDTGYVVTLVNFDYALIDIPDLASSSNDLLEWERNAELMPAKGSKVTLVLEPAGAVADAAAPPAVPAVPGTPAGEATPAPAAPAEPPTGDSTASSSSAFPESDVRLDEQKFRAMIDYHAKVLGPRQQALREAAEAHYKVIADLRKEQQRLITEADRIQRAIDQLERDWADATAPRPAEE